jgi:O-antigen/teichoic acid export membrane protein
LWLWREPLAQLLNNPALAAYIPLVGIYLLLMLMAVVLEILMTVRRQHLVASGAYALSDLARAAFYLLPVLLLANIQALLLGAIAFAAARFLAMLVYVRRQFGRALRIDGPSLRKQLAYAVPFGLAGVIELLQTNFHLYAVSHFFDAATFAIYAVGCLQIPLTDFLMTSTCNVMMVNMRDKVMAGDRGAVASIWLDSIRKLALVFFPLVAVLLISAQPLIVLLFTDSYQASVPIFMVWTLSMLLATLMTDGALRVFAQTRFLIFQNLIRLGVTIALIQWFLARFDLMGAILVTLLAMSVAKIAALARIKFVMGVPFGRLLPWSSLLAALIIACVAAGPAVLARSALTAVDAPLGVVLILTGLVYSLGYYVLLQWFGPMDKDEKRMLSNALLLPLLRLGSAWAR